MKRARETSEEVDEKDDGPAFISINGYVVPSTCSAEKMKLAVLNEHPRDRFICFSDEGHKYFVKGESTGWISTTKFIHDFFEDFDSIGTARRMVDRTDFLTNTRYKKYEHVFELDDEEKVQCLVQEWMESGRKASEAGTLLHRNIELFYNEVDAKDDRVEYQYFLDYAQEMADAGWVPYRTEWLVYDEVYKLTGSIDMVFFHPVMNQYIIRDWKMSKEIRKFGFGKKGQYPLQALQDCNYVHYCLQQNVYKYFLEHCCGLKVKDMAIVIFHSSNDQYVQFDIPDMSPKIDEMLAIRLMHLQA
jgi:hypothetical protein